MKHLKLFESNTNTIKISVVTFPAPGLGEVVACYPDEILEFYGDYYHNKIDDRIEGFIIGLAYVKKSYIMNLKVEVEYLECIDDNLNERVSELADSPPKSLKEIRYKVTKVHKINELLGIGNTLRRMKFEDEIEAEEIEHLINKSKISDLEYSEKKVKEEFIKIFSFNIESHRSQVDHEKIRVEFSNWLHPIKTPGLTDYNVFYNNKMLSVSRKKAKEIYKKLEKIYKA
mgnify:CR=1 FL=1